MSRSRGLFDAGRFPETHWSRLLRLGDPNGTRYDEERTQLVAQYWRPAFHYVRAIRRLSVQDAEDLTQEFFALVLRRVDFATLSPQKGTFRAFLKTALRRFVATVDSKAVTRAAIEATPSFVEQAEALCANGANPDPEQLFERERAREVLRETLAELENELGAEGKALYFTIFRQYSIEPAEGVTYESLAKENGITEHDVRNYLRAVRQKGRMITRRLLREHLFPDEDLEHELRRVLSP